MKLSALKYFNILRNMASVVYGLYKERRLSRRVRDVKWEKLCELIVSTNGDLDNLGLAVINATVSRVLPLLHVHGCILFRMTRSFHLYGNTKITF